MAKQNKAQKDTVERVMHEFKHGELKMRGGRKVKNPRQAIAIGLREAGASKYESKKDNASAACAAPNARSDAARRRAPKRKAAATILPRMADATRARASTPRPSGATSPAGPR